METHAKELLIRDVPDDVHGWIETERRQKLMKQKEFLLQLLDEARQGRNRTMTGRVTGWNWD